MKERSEQDRTWFEQKEQSEKINRLLLGGDGGCFHKGQFFRKALSLREIFRDLIKQNERI